MVERPIISPLVRKAQIFAAKRHLGTFRENRAHKLAISHCHETAELIKHSGAGEIEIAAAWLHDTVEGTPTTLKEIEELFGPEVRAIVEGLTDPPEFAKLNTLERKRRQAERLRSENPRVRRVKMADQISNMRSVAVDPPITWGRRKCLDYLEGARLISVECKGADDYLDALFEAVYLEAKTLLA